MPQSPQESQSIQPEHPYAQAAAQLNQLLRAGKSFSGHEKNCFYLNTSDARFANASLVSGLNFDDDARAVASGDWDRDGDLDLWIANRTAPQLRFLENRIGTQQPFVAFRLVGTTSNRDAIGALVQLFAKVGGEATTLRQSLRAGEGYLAQSSKVLHFGLGVDSKIDEVVVRWPSGQTERFAAPTPLNTYYQLVEGSGQWEPWQVPPAASLQATDPPTPLDASQTTANFLADSVPLPPLMYQRPDGSRIDASVTNGQPTLVNLWAPWCAPCLNELAEWTASATELRQHGAQVIALVVSSDAAEGEHESAEDVLRRLDFPFESGTATDQLLDVLQQVHNVVYDHHRTLPIPTTLLIDGSGRLASIYKGPVSSSTITTDIARLNLAPADRLSAALPFPGRWLALPGLHRINLLASRLWDRGYAQEALELTNRIDDTRYAPELRKARLTAAVRLQQSGQARQAVEQIQQAIVLAPNDADLLFQMGTLLAEQEQLPTAITYFRRALELNVAPRADLHANIGAALRQTGRLVEAEEHLRRAVELDASLAVAQQNLGLLCVAQQRFDDARAAFQAAVELDPSNENHRINLAMTLASLKRHDAALSQLNELLKLHPESLVGRIYTAEVLVGLGRIDDAIQTLVSVVQRQPDASRVWLRLAQLHEQQGEDVAALEAYQQADRLTGGEPGSMIGGDPRVRIRIAWILATSNNPQLRDGPQALQLAQQAAQSTGQSRPEVLDTLAAAYAENGRFADAIETARAALAQLTDDQATLRAAIELRIAGYRDGQPARSH